MRSEKSTVGYGNKETIRDLPIRSKEFTGYIDDFEKWLRVFGFAKSTIYYSPAYLRSFFHYLERKKICSVNLISNSQIRMYMNYLAHRTSKRTNKKLSQNYMLNHLTAIKVFSKYLRISSDIILDSSYRYSRTMLESRRWLKQCEVQKLYEMCNNDYLGHLNRVILGIYYGLGLRRMEGVGIDISDIQWNTGVVYVKKAKNARVRFVPMSFKVQNDIKTYIRNFRIPLLPKKRKSREQALLISEHGCRITGNSVYSRLQHMASKAGLTLPIPLHSLRHSIATHLLSNGMDLENIGMFLGHKSMESTQIYTHLIIKKE